MAEKISGIYRIVCVKNGRYYYGSSVDVWARWSQHKSALRKGTHHNPHMQKAWNKHGDTMFRIELIEIVSKFNLEEVENRYLVEHVGSRNCFNSGVDATRPLLNRCPWNKNRPWTKEERKKISQSLIGRKFSREEQDKRSKRDYPVVLDPQGNEYRVSNLARFCRDNRLKRYGMWAMINNRQKSSNNGWVVKK